MVVRSSKELLDLLTEGETPTPDMIDAIMADLEEDSYLDFKSGKITTKQHRRKHATRIIRSYVCAFANSDGGVLVIGVSDESPRQVVGCVGPGHEPLDKWAEGLVSDMAPYFSPLPRFHLVGHPDGDVLVIGIPRAPQLVPCVESNTLKYYLRFNQSTIEAPSYLISDLLLGRRQNPALDVRMTEMRCTSSSKSPPPEVDYLLRFEVENLGLIPARQVELGLVAWSLDPGELPVTKHLRSYLELEDIASDPLSNSWSLVHKVAPRMKKDRRDVEAFQKLELYLPTAIKTPGYESHHRRCFSAALYVMCSDSSPIWCELNYGAELKYISYSSDWLLQRSRLRRTAVSRPRVGVLEGDWSNVPAS